jgi:hypothetical protein
MVAATEPKIDMMNAGDIHNNEIRDGGNGELAQFASMTKIDDKSQILQRHRLKMRASPSLQDVIRCLCLNKRGTHQNAMKGEQLMVG